jgi:hypothetical protein
MVLLEKFLMRTHLNLPGWTLDELASAWSNHLGQRHFPVISTGHFDPQVALRPETARLKMHTWKLPTKMKL